MESEFIKAPHYETQEELWKLLEEGLNSGEGKVMTPEEWEKLRQI